MDETTKNKTQLQQSNHPQCYEHFTWLGLDFPRCNQQDPADISWDPNAWCLSSMVCQPAEDSQGHQRSRHPDALAGDAILCQLWIYTPKWHNRLNWIPDKIPSLRSLWVLKKKETVDWYIPPSPHSNRFNASKSMRGAEQMCMSGENGPWFDCLPACVLLRSSRVCWWLKGSDNIPLRNIIDASLSVMPSSFSCSDMAVV